MFSALSIILAIVLFIIQIPIKAIMLGLKASIAAGKLAGKAAVNLTGTEEQADELKERLQSAGQKASKVANTAKKTVNTTKKTAKATVNTAKKTGEFAKKKLDKIPEKIEKTARNTKKAVKMTAKTAKATGKLAVKLGKLSVKAVQLIIKALKLLLALIKALISLLLSLGVIGIIILVLIVVVLIVSILSSVLAINSESTFSSGSYSSGSSDVTDSGTDSGTGQEVIIDIDTSTLEASCETMAKWYLANVTTYQGGGKNVRKGYTCSILPNNQTVYDDCSGFAAAYASLVSGRKVEAYGSEQLYKGGQSYIDAGWTRYTIADLGGTSGLVIGDILVCNDIADSNCKGRHAEIYLGKGKSFGWGKVQASYPSSMAVLTDTTKNGYIIDGGSHIYGVVYRYTGGS